MTSVRVRLVFALALMSACAPSVKPELQLNRAQLDFGIVEVGGTYRLGVALTNVGDAPLAVSNVRFEPGSDEVELEGLPVVELGAGNRHVVSVVYRPTADGSLSATLFVDAADGQPSHQVLITGSAVTLNAVALIDSGASCAGASGSIDFGRVSSGVPAVRTFTVEATGSGTITIVKATVSPESAGLSVEGLGTGLQLAPGETGTLTVRSDPTRAGALVGAVTLETSSFAVPRLVIPLCGTGLVPMLCATPASVTFGDVAPAAAATHSVTVSSCGNLPVTLLTAAVVPDATAAPGFSLVPAPVLPQALAPGESAVLDLRFDSTSTAIARSKVRLTTSSPVTPEVFVSMGANLPPPCDVTLGATSLHFHKYLAATQQVRLTNNATTDCVIERLDIVPFDAPFSLDRPLSLPTVLAGRSSMELSLTYAPPSSATTASTATFQVELDWLHEVTLLGDPRPPSGCHLFPQTNRVDFGLINGPTSVSQTLVLSNVGTGQCLVRGITFSEPGFRSFIPSTIIAGQSQTVITVTWLSGAGPPIAATMTIASSDREQPQLDVPIVAGHIRCDPQCQCTAQQTPTFWRFSDQQFVSSAVSTSTGIGAFMESCEPIHCASGQAAVEVDRGVVQCVAGPPDCAGGLGLEFAFGEWGCTPCELVVQFGGLFGGLRACAPRPTVSCGPGTVPTFDAQRRTWGCAATCDNGAYDQHMLSGTLVCIPC